MRNFFAIFAITTFVGFGGLLAQPGVIESVTLRLSTGPCEISSGSSSPESAVTGDPCDMFFRDDGPPHLYVKHTGSSNTGWATVNVASVTSGITASTTQTQGQGALTATINELATVANANDTVTLPSAEVGMVVYVVNNGANTAQIFPASGDNLGQGVDTAETLASGASVTYSAHDATNWDK